MKCACFVDGLREWVVLTAVIGMAAGLCSAQMAAPRIDWESFRLPEQYSATVSFEITLGGNPVGAQEHRVVIDRDWLRMDIFLVVDGVGESLHQARYATMEGSWVLTPAAFSATKSSRFSETLTDAGEIDFSPMPIVRAFVHNPDIRTEVIREAEGIVTLGVWSSPIDPTGYLEMDYRDDQIVEARWGRFGEGQWMNTVLYKDWTELPSGTHIPARAVSTIDTRTPDGKLIRSARLEMLKETGLTAESRRLVLPESTTIFDEIESVTRRSSGEVLGPILHDDSPTDNRTGVGPSSRLIEKLLVTFGVLMVVGAGVVLGKRMRNSV